jgi:hypothetical protein
MIDLRKVNVPFQRLQYGGPVVPRPPAIGWMPPAVPMPTLEDIYRLMAPDTPKKKKEDKKDKKPAQKTDKKPSDWSANVTEGEGYQKGGQARSTDTVPAMLTPGEFVMNRGASMLFHPHLRMMNELGKMHPVMRGNKSPLPPRGRQEGGQVPGSERRRGLPADFSRNVNLRQFGGRIGDTSVDVPRWSNASDIWKAGNVYNNPFNDILKYGNVFIPPSGSSGSPDDPNINPFTGKPPFSTTSRHGRDRLDDPNITYTVTGGQPPTGGFNPYSPGNIDPFNAFNTGNTSVPGGIGNVLSFIFGGMGGGSGPSPGQPPRLL